MTNTQPKRLKKNKSSPIGFTVEGILAMAGVAKISKRCGISPQSIYNWNGWIPDAHARDVAILAGLPLSIVRPDLVQAGADA